MKVIYHVVQILILSVFALNTQAASFNINPISLMVSNDEPMASLTVTNTSNSHSVLQADIVQWKKNNVLTSGEYAEDVVISPPVFTLAPKQSQLLRISWQAKKMIDDQRTYRVIIREIVSNQEAKIPNAASKLNIALAFSLPLFIQPADIHKSCLFEIKKTDNNVSVLKVINQGNITLLINAYDLVDDKQKIVSNKTFVYVLPKQEHTWRLVIPRKNITNINAMINGEWKQFSVQQK